jgi:nucleoid-associated protein YgaU
LNCIIRSAAWVAGLAGVLIALLFLLWSAAAHTWAAVVAPGPASLDEVLTLLAAVMALSLALWLGLSTMVAVAAHLPGRIGGFCAKATAALAPALTRRTAAILVGAAVGGAMAPGAALAERPAPPALAGPGFHATHARPEDAAPTSLNTMPGPGFRAIPEQVTSRVEPNAIAEQVTSRVEPSQPAEGRLDADPAPRHTVEALAPGWVPERPHQRPQAAATLVTTAPPGHSHAAEVVVHRGDTLWDIVAGQLGTEASDAEVAEAWPRWYAANRDIIGENPDLILPGQVLRAPTGARAR